MIKRLIIIGLMAVFHATAFIAIYFGRRNGVAICGSDIVLFAFPFIVAMAAYAAVFFKIIKMQNLLTRGLLVMGSSAVVGVGATIIGMTIAFSLWGT